MISKNQKYLQFVFLFPEDIQKISLCNELQTLKACEKIPFLLLNGILTSRSRNSRKLLSIAIQLLLFSQTDG